MFFTAKHLLKRHYREKNEIKKSGIITFEDKIVIKLNKSLKYMKVC